MATKKLNKILIGWHVFKIYMVSAFVFIALTGKSQCAANSDSLAAYSFPYNPYTKCSGPMVQATAGEIAETYFMRQMLQKALGIAPTNCPSNTDSLAAYSFPYQVGSNCTDRVQCTAGEAAMVYFLRQLFVNSGNTPITDSAWSLFDNKGITTSNFIGTINNAALRFKTDNTFSGEIDPINGNTGMGFFAINGAISHTLQYNTGVGYVALKQNAAYYNVAVGAFALEDVIEGSYNTAVGFQAGGSATTIGSHNSFLGYEAGGLVHGNFNTIIGDSSAFTNIALNLNQCTFLGARISATSNIYNTTVIGDSAIGSVKNSVVVGNHNVSTFDFNGDLSPYYSGSYQPGNSGNVLISNGPAVAPNWVSDVSIIPGTQVTLNDNTTVSAGNEFVIQTAGAGNDAMQCQGGFVDVYNGTSGANGGLLIRSASYCWVIAVSDLGVISATKVTCP